MRPSGHPTCESPYSGSTGFPVSPNGSTSPLSPSANFAQSTAAANDFEMFLDEKVPKQKLFDLRQVCEDLKKALEQWRESQFRWGNNLQMFQSCRFTSGSAGIVSTETAAERDLLSNIAKAEGSIKHLMEQFYRRLSEFVNTLTAAGQIMAGAVMDQWKTIQKSWQWGHPMDKSFLLLSQRWQFLSENLEYCKLRVDEIEHENRYAGDSSDPLGSACLTLKRQMEDVVIQFAYQSFVVSKQPPMLVKNSISSGVRILAAQRHYLLENQAPTVECKLVLMEDVLSKPNESPNDVKPYGTVSLDKQQLTFMDVGDKLLGVDPKIKITNMTNRKKDKTAEKLLTIKQKYCLLYYCQLNYGGRQVLMSTVSLPFVISVHGTQDSQILGSIFWDLAFSNFLSLPLAEVDSVKWPEFAKAISYLFTGYVQLSWRQLDDTSLNCIAQQLFGRQMNHFELEIATVTREMVFEHMKTNSKKVTPFSFWDWFFSIMEMLKHKPGRHNLKEFYESTNNPDSNGQKTSFIEGFITKQEAEHRLANHNCSAMILRFSNRTLAGIVVVYRRPDGHIEHLAPFTMVSDFKRFTLPYLIDRVKELSDVPFIYPDIPKSKLTDAASEQDRDVYLSSEYVQFHLMVESAAHGEQTSSVIKPIPDWDLVDIEAMLKGELAQPSDFTLFDVAGTEPMES